MARARDERWEPVDWRARDPAARRRLRAIVDEHGPDAIAFYISGQLLTEDYYVVNKLAKGFLGTNNVDSNSRLCMSSAVAGYRASLGSDGPPASLRRHRPRRLPPARRHQHRRLPPDRVGAHPRAGRPRARR